MTATRAGILAALTLVALLAAGCDYDTEDTRSLAPEGRLSEGGVTVESAQLVTLLEDYEEPDVCLVEGRIRNGNAADRRVTVSFEAFDRGGGSLGVARVVGLRVPARGLAFYSEEFENRSSDRRLNDCDRVHRFEVTDITVSPA